MWEVLVGRVVFLQVHRNLVFLGFSPSFVSGGASWAIDVDVVLLSSGGDGDWGLFSVDSCARGVGLLGDGVCGGGGAGALVAGHIDGGAGAFGCGGELRH